MDLDKYLWIIHQQHVFMNPLSGAKVDEIIELLDLPPESRILDMACGKAEFLLRTVERWGARGPALNCRPDGWRSHAPRLPHVASVIE